MKDTLLAIDPGAKGALVLDTSCGPVEFHKMPETTADLWQLINSIQLGAQTGAFDGTDNSGKIRCYLEKVSGYAGGPGQPGGAMFTFGRGFGHLEMALIAAGIPTIEVPPQRWQKELGCGNSKQHASKTAWKNHLKGIAQQLYPNHTITLQFADAALILEYARRMERTVDAVQYQQPRPEAQPK